MEKKYYFRGLGLGIIVTAVIMGIALSDGKKKEMTDEEVIARAKELGMIEDSRLLDPAQEEGEDAGEAEDKQEDGEAQAPVKMDIAVAAEKEAADQKAAEEKTQDQEEKKPVVSTPAPQDTTEAKETQRGAKQKAEPAGASAAEQKEDTNEMTKQDEDVPEPEIDGAKSVTISSGDGSYTVARKLAEAGVVSSAESYDDFLCANGYDKKLRTGTFQIPANASEQQIARIVTGQE